MTKWKVVEEQKWPFTITIEDTNGIIASFVRVAYSSEAKTLEQMKDAVGFDHVERDRIRLLIKEQLDAVTLMAKAPEMAEALRLIALHSEEEKYANLAATVLS